MSLELVARWEVSGGAYFVELEEVDGRFFYNARGTGGIMEASSRDAAIARLETMIASGYFLPQRSRLRFHRTI